MKWDFTISVGDILAALSICGTVAAAAWGVMRRLSKVLVFFEEYPPHRHVGDQILYPKGYSPEAPAGLGDGPRLKVRA
jgi:hypothetical protein